MLAPGFGHDPDDQERDHQPGCLLHRHGQPQQHRAAPGGPPPRGRKPVPADGGSDQQRNEEEIGHPADRVADVDVQAGHDGRERGQSPRQHREQDDDPERPGADVHPHGRLGRDAQGQQRHIGLERQGRVGQVRDRLPGELEGVAVRGDVKQREGRRHGVQVGIEAVHGQLRRVLIEGDLVRAVVRGDEHLEIAPQGQRRQHRDEDGPVSLALPAGPHRLIGQPRGNDRQQAGQPEHHHGDGQPRAEG
jgi:hypothetical protein